MIITTAINPFNLVFTQGDVTTSYAELSDEVTVRNYANSSPAIRWTAYVLGALFYLKKKFPELDLSSKQRSPQNR